MNRLGLDLCNLRKFLDFTCLLWAFFDALRDPVECFIATFDIVLENKFFLSLIVDRLSAEDCTALIIIIKCALILIRVLKR